MFRVGRDFIKYASGVFGRTLVAGIPQIVKAKGSFRKIVRILIFIFCCLGFLYQSIEFYLMYMKYPSIVDVQLTSPLQTILPALTSCAYGGFSRERYCKENPCRVLKREKLCRRYPIHCMDDLFKNGLQNLEVPYSNFSDLYWKQQAEILKYMSSAFTKDIFHVYCGIYATGPGNLTHCSPQYSPPVRGLLKVPPLCISYNLHIGNPNPELRNISREGVLIHISNNVPFDTLTGPQSPSFQLSLHTPESVSNPFIDGMQITNGISYRIRLREVVKIRLPAPYETDCVDYMELWKQRGGNGPLNKMQCIEECKVNHSMADYGCVIHTIWYPHDEKRCEPERAKEKQLEYAEKCSRKCKLACREISYEMKMEQYESHAAYHCRSYFQVFKPFNSFLEFLFSDLERLTYQYKPKYEFVEAFGYIGGYMGIWLGISLVALFSFFESLVMVVSYPIVKKMKERERSRIRQFHREEMREDHLFRRNRIMHL